MENTFTCWYIFAKGHRISNVEQMLILFLTTKYIRVSPGLTMLGKIIIDM